MSKVNKSDIEALMAQTNQLFKQIKKKTCRGCKQQKQIYESSYCEDCWKEISEKREAKRKEARHKQDNGYVYVYDDSGKLVLEHRLVMSQHLGRELKKEEVVLHLDGDKSNNDLSNLMLGFKNGTPLNRLVCKCGLVGEFTINHE